VPPGPGAPALTGVRVGHAAIANAGATSADRNGMANDVRIDDVAEAVQMLAAAVAGLANLLIEDPAAGEEALAARRLAHAAERMTERVLLGA